MQSKFLPFIFLSIYLGCFCCAQECSQDPFNCGGIAYLSYPFWGGARTSDCGRQGFHIVCTNNTPVIKMLSLSYRVEKLDFSTNTVTLARRDLQETFCPNPLVNTTIDWDLFQYPPDSTDRNLTLYFDCTAARDPPLPNAFTCGDDTSNLFKIGDASSSDPGKGITCKNNISVPINDDDAQSLQNPTATAIKALRSALITGFSIQWFNYSLKMAAPYCNSKVYGSCSPTLNVLPTPCNSTTCRNSPGGVPTVLAPADAPSRPGSGYVLPLAPNAGNHPQSPRNPQSRNDPGESRAKKIIIGVALGVAGMITVSISIYCILKRRHPESKPDVEGVLLQWGSLTPKRYKYSEIKKITKSFADKLGEGGYGRVYKGKLPDGCPVAVKVLNDTKSNGEDFINEVASISRTSHVNIVTLLGFCYEANRRALVYEFMPNSSLDQFLNSNGSAGRLDLEKLCSIAVGTAKGLEYLHTGCTTRIVHFDIKPQNILLDEDFCPKISDFGLAKLCNKKQSILSVIGTRGTIGYIAPEVFSRNFGGVSHKSDVYSYGMMILEMAGVGKAEVIRSSENYFPDRIYEQVISEVGNDTALTMDGEEESRKKMMLVGFWCIQTIPSSRPSISQVLEMLQGSLESIQIPPKPFLFSPPNLPTHEASSSFAESMENSGVVGEILTSAYLIVSNPN